MIVRSLRASVPAGDVVVATPPPAATAEPRPAQTRGGDRSIRALLRLLLVPVLVATLGALLSILAFQQQHAATMARWEESLRDRALDRARAMQEKINDVESSLRTAVGFFEASHRIDEPEFAAFTRHVLAANRSIRLLAWAPRVAGSQRDRFEALAQLQGERGFAIRDSGADGANRPAATRPEYFPLLYSAGRETAADVTGLDLVSTPAHRDAIDQATLTRHLVAVPAIPQILGESEGFVLLAPVFRPADGQIGSGAIEEFEGLLVAAVGLPELIDAAFGDIAPRSFDLHLFQGGPPGSWAPLAYYPAANLAAQLPQPSYADAVSDLHWTAPLRVGEEQLRVVLRATPALLATAPHTRDMSTLLLGLLGSALAAAFMFTSQVRSRRLERMGGELRSAMDTLSLEMAEREAAQVHLRDSESRYRMLVERMNEGVVVVDQDSVVTYANQRLMTMLGLAPEAFIGRPLSAFVDPQDSHLLHDQLGQRADGQRPSCEMRWRRSDGSELVTLVSPEPLWDEDGVYRGSFATFTDITDRVCAAREVQRRDAILEAITAAATELMRTPALDEALPRAIEVLGRAMGLDRILVFEARTPGGVLADLRHEWCADGIAAAIPSGFKTNLDLAAAGLGRWLELFRDNHIVSGPVDALPDSERRLLAASGARSVLVVPIHVDGQWCGHIAFDDCRSERNWLQTEIEALRTLAELIGMSIARARTHKALADANTIVEGSPAVLFRWGRHGGWNVLYVSQNVTQLGWTPEDFAAGGVTYDRIVIPEDRARVSREIKAYLAEGIDRFRQEYRIRTKDGRILWVEDHTAAVYDENGRLAYLQGTVEDVTARRQAEEALRMATDELNERVKELTFLHRFASLRSAPDLTVDEIAREVVKLLPSAFRHPNLQARITVDGCSVATADLRVSGTQLAAEDHLGETPRVRVEVFYPDQQHRAGDAPFLPEEVALLQQVATDLASTLVRREVEEQLRTAELIVEKSPLVLYRLVPQDHWPITYVSRNVRQFGYTPEQIQALPYGAASLLHPADRKHHREALERTVREGKEHLVRQYRLRDGNGAYRWVEDHARVIRSADGQVAAVEGMIVDISERRRAEEQIAYLARHDALTDLPNRTTFMERLGLALAQTRRGGPPFAVLCIDLDHFKDINDTRGHAIGDMLLREMAARLAHTARDTDTVARLGGDEFAILQAQIHDPADSAALAQRVIDALTKPVVIDGAHIVSGGSIGIAVSQTGIGTAETLMMQADMALYRAKDDGRGTYRFHTQDMDTSVRRRVTIAEELRHAIAGKQLYLDYQPQVDLASGVVIGVEALVRWRHPERGFVSPGEFIPIAEASGLILRIGAWVLDEALRQGKAWLDEGLSPIAVAVNLSGVEFKAGTFAAEIAEALARHQFPPELLELELTESVFMEVTQERSETLKFLRKLGVRFAIDDFGTGYSSLEYLRSFHVDRLKIARSFIDGVTPGSSEAAIVEATIGLGKALGVSVLAEGVETVEELSFLRSRGCDEAQGYLFSRPVSAEKISELLRRSTLLPEPQAPEEESETLRAAG